MDKWNLIIDVARCNNCASCVLANMDEHVGNDFPGYSAPQPQGGAAWIGMQRVVRGEGEHIDVAYMPTLCNHCDRPPCAEGSGGAVVKRADGIVLIDPVKAKGRRDIVERCPYGRIHWNEELQLPQTWTFDAHLLDAGWPVPRCEQACPTGALKSMKTSDARMQELAREQGLEVLQRELSTAPRVYYRNLHRVFSRFIAGTVLKPAADASSDCLEGCKVSLLREGVVLADTLTDAFGDFRFDGLPDECIGYELLFEAPAYGVLRLQARTEQCGTSVGLVMFSPLARAAAHGEALIGALL